MACSLREEDISNDHALPSPEPQEANASTIRKRSPRRLSATEHQAVLGVLHERRFADELPGQVFLD